MARLPIEFAYNEETEELALKRMSLATRRRFDQAPIEYLPRLFKQVAKEIIKKTAKKDDDQSEMLTLYTSMIELGYFAIRPERQEEFVEVHGTTVDY